MSSASANTVCEAPQEATERGETTCATRRTIVSTKVQKHHHQRCAIVYVRQSTAQQVRQNKESTARQYGLAQRAMELGWLDSQIEVIDEDQAHSGRTSEKRLGFQRLLAEVSLNHVGLILGLEMSRIARCNKDWHHLLELCGIFDTLLADQDGIYDPTDYNDRLVLGLKGTMSEAELHILRGRLNEGRRNKARRGELCSRLPMGYVKTLAGEIVLDPDEQVQGVVRLIFAKFEELGSAAGVLKYMVRYGILLGLRQYCGASRGELNWREPYESYLTGMLHHPIYTGAYVHGRRATDPKRKRLAGASS